MDQAFSAVTIRAKRRLIQLVVLSSVIAGAGYAGAFVPGGAPAWANWCLALGANGLLMSLMALGASRRGTLPPALRWTFIGMFVLCSGAFAIALALPADEGAGGTLLFGLPLRTAILLFAVGVVPMFILPFAYALTFDSSTLSADDLAALRAVRAVQRSRTSEASQGANAGQSGEARP